MTTSDYSSINSSEERSAKEAVNYDAKAKAYVPI